MNSNASGVRSTERACIHRQKGVTLTGMILVSVLIIGVVLLAIKVVPVYVEYHTIQKNFRGMADDPALANARRPELIRAWCGTCDRRQHHVDTDPGHRVRTPG